METKVLRAMLFYDREDERLGEIRMLLADAGVCSQWIQRDHWLSAIRDTNIDAIDAFVLVVSDSARAENFVYTIFDLGRPAVVLNCSGLDCVPEEFGKSVFRLGEKDAHEEFPRRLCETIRVPFPVPLQLPSMQCLEKLQGLSIFGASQAFLHLYDDIEKFSRSRAPVLIQGETGTGKELVARALHYLGSRKNEAFVPVNCSSLPDALFENEIFGHERGAFTDAKEKFAGLVQQAGEGTLFLDEVDSLQPRAQASLLRFLQDGSYRTLGSAKLIKGRCAILAATNKSLQRLVAKGHFRDDLFYRLNAITIHIPPLRQRPQDIVLLARIYLRTLCKQYGQSPKSFHPDTLNWLASQDWPGNVRELENYIHREFLLSDRPIIQARSKTHENSGQQCSCVCLPESMPSLVFNDMRNQVVRDFERQYLHRLMLVSRGNVSHAARLAGKERRCLGKLLKKHGIDRENYLAEYRQGIGL